MRHQSLFGLIVIVGLGTVAAPDLPRAEGIIAEPVIEPAVASTGPLYAYGPEVLEPPRPRPRYYGRAYGMAGPYDRRYLPRNRGYVRPGQAYGGYRYRDYRPYRSFNDRRYANRGYGDWSNGRPRMPYRSRTPRAPRPSGQDQYAARIIVPQAGGQWRDLGPVYQRRPY